MQGKGSWLPAGHTFFAELSVAVAGQHTLPMIDQAHAPTTMRLVASALTVRCVVPTSLVDCLPRMQAPAWSIGSSAFSTVQSAHKTPSSTGMTFQREALSFLHTVYLLNPAGGVYGAVWCDGWW